ncbi:MAG: sigma-70 family RNA polymerase sigma factor [Planctomycetota bacterium]
MKDLSLDSTDLAWLTNLARALLGEAHAADDLVQETAVAAIEGLPPDAPRRAWLASVARRLAARRFRGESRRARREQLAARPEALPDSAELVARAEIAERLTAAARRLPEPYRRAILLRFLEGLSPDEIAREEGKPADTVRWRIRRGLELLREELVRADDRDWSSWCVLLLPLARAHGGAGLATAGASGGVSGMVVSLAAMKTTVAVVFALGCAGLWFGWDSGERELDEPRIVGAPAVEPPSVRPALELEAAEPAAVEPQSRRTPTASEARAEPPATEASPEALAGRVVDEAGDPVRGATVFLTYPGQDGDVVHALTETDWRGSFRFWPEAWAAGAGQGDAALDLGVTANGFLRRVVPDVLADDRRDDLVITLERGRALVVRVVDERDRPVGGLELLAHSAYAGIAHVSPSQRRLRARRAELAGASSSYDHCLATTDEQGEVVFQGLPDGTLQLLSLDPGWTLEGQRPVEAADSYLIWVAKRRLGVRLLVVERATGRPVERASATFAFEATFANGEVMDLEQWVGRGAGEVSFVLGPELLPGLEQRTITRAAFYGTVWSGDGEVVEWAAEPLEDAAGVVGVAEVTVEVDSATDVAEAETAEELGVAQLTLDVSYEDSTPFDGELEVSWSSVRGPRFDGDGTPTRIGVGRYRIEVPAGDLRLVVADRYSYGSLPPWSRDVRCDPDREVRVQATLPRGGAALISRPDGWSGEWFVHASWRPRGEEEWRGSWGFSTADSSLKLTVLRPAEWRFELRRYSSLEPDPLVRTAVLEEGVTTRVDE